MIKHFRRFDGTTQCSTPLWVKWCKDDITVVREGKNFKVVGCPRENVECYGCHPRGTFPFDPRKLEVTKVVDSMQVDQKHLEGDFIKQESIPILLKKYVDDNYKLWYWFQGISNDLHAIFVMEVKRG